MNNKIQIYVVDDSLEMIHCMKEAFAKSDVYQIVGSATNGEQCIKELHGKHIDVLLLDLIMPKKDGISVLSDLKRIRLKLNISYVRRHLSMILSLMQYRIIRLITY